MLETGGKIGEHYNLGGIKAGDGLPNQWWRGETYTTPTWEYVKGKRVQTTATWRSYDSVYAFYKDQDQWLGSARYARVRAAKTAEEQAEALQLSGYATDPAYSNKLRQLINTYSLTKYDEIEGGGRTDDEGGAGTIRKASATGGSAGCANSSARRPAGRNRKLTNDPRAACMGRRGRASCRGSQADRHAARR
ncbi:glycoside hydrolase family 73 protein [Cohnella rhizosphaerae]|uniref:glycoside hydrolase family 73 protein n=1 Tax=Cohnella rhizosphaerae TaxID=1457232 RepID=UPI0024074E33|nr:glucosaminidase domain-containing protein [Cohnella rhizosphaerae]